MGVKVRDALNLIRTIPYTHSSATVKDTVYLLNGRPMLALESKDANVENIFLVSGLIEYDKATGAAWVAGDTLYWDNSAGNFTKTSTSNTPAGIAAEAAGSSATTGIVLLIAEFPVPDASITLAKLATGIAPSHKVFAAGVFTTAGGDANEAIAITGLLTTDIVVVSLAQAGSTPRTITTAIAASGQINVVMSGDPSTDHKINYVVLRAAA